MRKFGMMMLVLVAVLGFGGVAFAETQVADCCNYNNCSHDALHGAYTHIDKLSANAANSGHGHCREHGCAATAGSSTHVDVHCAHDMGHQAYCAANCSAHHASEKAACGADHGKDCGQVAAVAKDCTEHACTRDCDHATQKCPHCGHSHCGLHGWACHTTHHHIVSTHACAHQGCDEHCHVDGLRAELRAKVEEVRLHHQLRG